MTPAAFPETAIRKQFPILSRKIGKHPLVYLDNAATTQKPLSVIQAMDDYYSHTNANIHRGIHQLAEESTRDFESARERTASFLGVSSREIIFTRGTTDSINQLARMLSPIIKRGDEIVITQLEHHSNLVPWQQLAKQKGALLRFIPLSKTTGQLSLASLSKIITSKTKIVSLTHVSNVLGSISPVKEIVARAHEVGAFVVLDAAQSVGHLPLSLSKLDVDFAAFSSHKMYGPTGIGVLYGKESLLSSLEPVVFGGEMVRDVSFDFATWNDLPWKFEPGTPPIAEAIGLGAAVDFLQKYSRDAIRSHEKKLLRRAYEGLSSLDGVSVFGPQDIVHRSGVVSFSVKNVHPHDVAALLNEQGIAVRAGHHCAMPLTQLLGVPSTSRASVGIYTTSAEIDSLLVSVKRAHSIFSRKA